MRIREHLRRLRGDTSGNVAIMTAATIVGMSLMIGGSVDVLRHEMLRKRAQNAFDRCTLAAASLEQQEEPKAVCESFIRAAGLEMPPNLQWQIINQTGFKKVCVIGRYDLDTTFMRLASIDDLKVPVESCAEERERRVEISLALDMSASMSRNVTGTSDRRMDLLKPAAMQFVDTLLDTDEQKRLTSISLVPYAGQVNLGPGMFDLLYGTSASRPRRHLHSSCLQFDRGDYDNTGVPNFSTRPVASTQAAHFSMGALKNYGTILGQFYDPNTNFTARGGEEWRVPGTRTYFHQKNGRWRRYAEIWQCPDDPHAFMRTEVGVRNTASSGLRHRNGLLFNSSRIQTRSIFDPVRRESLLIGPRVTTNLLQGQIFDHVFDCENVTDITEARPVPPGTDPDDVPRLFPIDGRMCGFIARGTTPPARNLNRVFRDRMVGVDEDRTQVTYLSNDPDYLKQEIEQYRMYDSTGTHIATKWATVLLDPAFRTHVRQARTRRIINSTFDNRPANWNDQNTRKYMVIMTDGRITNQFDLNDADVAYGNVWEYTDNGNTRGAKVQTTSVAYARDSNNVALTAGNNVSDFLKVCAKAKEMGIEIFTIGFDLARPSDAATRRTLEQCASTRANYYNVGANIGEAFDAIAAAINKVRLTS